MLSPDDFTKEICQGQNGARNENWPRPPKLAKFGSE